MTDQDNPLLGDKAVIAERQMMNAWGCCCEQPNATSIEFWWWARAIGVTLLICALVGVVLSI